MRQLFLLEAIPAFACGRMREGECDDLVCIVRDLSSSKRDEIGRIASPNIQDYLDRQEMAVAKEARLVAEYDEKMDAGCGQCGSFFCPACRGQRNLQAPSDARTRRAGVSASPIHGDDYAQRI